MNQLAWVEPFIQVATAGGFGALVWYLIVKHIPKIEERHRGERKEFFEEYVHRLKENDEELKVIVNQYNVLMREMLEALAKLRNHHDTGPNRKN